MRTARRVSLVLLLLSGPAWSAGGAPSIESILRDHDGKVVTLRMDDGGEVSGKVAGLSTVTVKISGLTGKEFYDAVVRLDRISAVTYRARER